MSDDASVEDIEALGDAWQEDLSGEVEVEHTHRCRMSWGTKKELTENLTTPATVDIRTGKVEFYAIIHKPTGKLLPESKGSYTQQEPTDPTFWAPRLFTHPETANRALAQYRRGIQSLYRSGGRRSGFFSDDDYEEYIEVSEAKHRVREDYEVIKVELGAS